MSRFVRSPDLSIQLLDGGRLLVRAPARGIAARVPPHAALLLSFCEVPRTIDEVTAAFGPPAAQLFTGLVDAELLLAPENALETPVFFHNFASLDTHRRMLSDRVRLEAYADAIAEIVQPGDVVIDGGTGSAVLACLAARAGARRVFAVDNAEVLDFAASVVRESGLTDIVELVRGDLATVALPEPARVLVTETFGSLALAEGAGPDLTACANANLVDGGVVIPAGVRLAIAPISDAAAVDEVFAGLAPFRGVALDALAPAARGRAVSTAIPAAALAASGQPFATLAFPRQATRAAGDARFDDLGGVTIYGFCAWFDLLLSPGVTLSTAPDAPLTHWEQTLLPTGPFTIPDGASLTLTVEVEPAPDDRRGLEVHIKAIAGSTEQTWRWRVR